MEPFSSFPQQHYQPIPNVTALVISLAFLFLVICCGPVCCIFYAALRYKALRQRSLQERTACFAVQWRTQNPVLPFHGGNHRSSARWSDWHLYFSPLPWEFKGLSTAMFQSPEPILALTSSNLQQIRFNPFIGARRVSQSVQCPLPLMHDKEGFPFLPACRYFEVSIISCRPYGKRELTFGRFEGSVAVGLAAKPAPPFRLPGLDPVSVGFHSMSGQILSGSADEVQVAGMTWSRVGATVGCGYDVDEGVIYFTQGNGPPIFTNIGIPDNTKNHLFPTVGADCDVTVVVNMGQHGFLYDVVTPPDLAGNLAETAGGETENGRKSIVVTVQDETIKDKEEDHCVSPSPMDKQVQTCPAWGLLEKEVQSTVVQISIAVQSTMSTMGKEVSGNITVMNGGQICGSVSIPTMRNQVETCQSTRECNNLEGVQENSCSNMVNEDDPPKVTEEGLSSVTEEHSPCAYNDMKKDQKNSSPRKLGIAQTESSMKEVI